MKLVVLLIAAACSSAVADKTSDGQKLASADLAATIASEKLAGAWQLGPLYWDSTQKHTIGEARLVFAADATDKLADAPFVAGDKIVLDLGPPAKILAHADAKKLREAAKRTADVETALAIARAKLKTLPRYSYWVKEGWKYETRVWLQGTKILVAFDTPNVTDQNINIEVDPIGKKVLSVKLGMA